jgi:hypothetical protein
VQTIDVVLSFVQGQASRDMSAVAAEKRKLKLELDGAYTQLNSVQLRVKHAEEHLVTQAEEHGRILTALKIEHEHALAAANHNKESLVHKVTLLEREHSKILTEHNELIAKQASPIGLSFN